MSATETTTTPTTEENVVPVEDARIEEGKENDVRKLTARVKEWAGKLAEAISLGDKAGVALAKADAKVRRYFFLPDGHPDWAGATVVYQTAIAKVRDEAFERAGLNRSQQQKARAAARQAMRYGTDLTADPVKLSPLDAEIVAYIRERISGFGEKDAKGEYVIAVSDEKFKTEVRKQYRRQPRKPGQGGHDIPEVWERGTPSKNKANAGPVVTAGEANEASVDAAANLVSEATSEGRVEQDYAARAALRVVSSYVTMIVGTKDSDVKRRTEQQAILGRIRDLIAIADARLAQTLTSEQRESLATLAWNEKDENA